ncbi:MAG: peptidoglycan editing factor PgeF [Alphaproteobacteria bacterium]|jgi:YfiH family protein|nr:peptidoglycan editing factor PgeF [Alphaproteobacteria bacterium]
MTLFLTHPLLCDLPHVGHAFFTRQGGVSKGAFDSLNVSTTSADARGHVLENMTRIASTLGLGPGRLCLPQQDHTNQALFLDSPFPLEPFEARPMVDALYTSARGLALSVNTADCVPILIAHKEKPFVAAIHAGWKGALSGIVENTLDALTHQGCPARECVAALGPCIAQDSYEVDLAVREPFLTKSKENDLYFKENPENPSRYLFNLPGYVMSLLNKKGLLDVAEPLGNTYTNPGLFFSCRRSFHEQNPPPGQKPLFGCQLSVIWLK